MTKLIIRPNRMGGLLNHWFDGFQNFPVNVDEDEQGFAPRVNVTDEKDYLALTFELPGIDRKDIKVMVKDHTLTVSGERKFEREEEGDRFVRSEIDSGSFNRSFTLPENVVDEKVSADYKNGMLQIRLPKVEEAKPKEIEINVS